MLLYNLPICLKHTNQEKEKELDRTVFLQENVPQEVKEPLKEGEVRAEKGLQFKGFLEVFGDIRSCCPKRGE